MLRKNLENDPIFKVPADLAPVNNAALYGDVERAKILAFMAAVRSTRALIIDS